MYTIFAMSIAITKLTRNKIANLLIVEAVSKNESSIMKEVVRLRREIIQKTV